MAAHVPKIPEEILSHQVFQEELLEMANNATILKHLKQQVSFQVFNLYASHTLSLPLHCHQMPCCGQQEEPAIVISRLLLYICVWTSTKNEWNAQNAI